MRSRTHSVASDLTFENDGDTFVVTPPTFRFDLEIEEDLIGEVARLIGYENIPAHPPRTAATMRAEPEERRSAHDVRRALSLAGYTELINYSFVDAQSERDFAPNADPIAVLNPIASHMSVMRSTLLGGLVNALCVQPESQSPSRSSLRNWPRVHRRDPATTPMGRCRSGEWISRIAWRRSRTVANDDEQWAAPARDVDFFDVKGDIESLLPAARFMPAQHPALHPGRSAMIEIDGRRVGIIGQLHPRLQQHYELPKPPIVFELDLAPLLVRALPRHGELSRFQPVQRDISVTVADSVPVAAMIDAVHARGAFGAPPVGAARVPGVRCLSCSA